MATRITIEIDGDDVAVAGFDEVSPSRELARLIALVASNEQVMEILAGQNWRGSTVAERIQKFLDEYEPEAE